MDSRASPSHVTPPSWQWEVFCRVIDNLGDIGVCWRLCADLASRGHQVRLWIDHPGALAWMAPGALEGTIPGVQVMHWTQPLPEGLAESLAPADVWIEAFGCDPAAECTQHLARRLTIGAPAPVWINLEYMSAEPYVERSHRLPSPVMSGSLKGLTKWFFYPGFTEATGGLLRESDLLSRQARFDAAAWRLANQLPVDGKRQVSLFCYEPAALGDVLRGAGNDPSTSRWLVTPGRAAKAMARELESTGLPGPSCQLQNLPFFTQREYDHLLWSSDLNFVRGEDSLVRALWAGRPFVWHIYPQHDGAHRAKLEAFLDWLQAPDALREMHRRWNGMVGGGDAWPGWDEVDRWRPCVLAARQRLLKQPDLVSQLLGFIQEKR
jgi:uncharacterized repeat protein (TIGR03837 family)